MFVCIASVEQEMHEDDALDMFLSLNATAVETELVVVVLHLLQAVSTGGLVEGRRVA